MPPFYDYECQNPPCFHVLTDVLVASWKTPPPTCPKCGGDMVRKNVYPLNFELKGNDWASSNYGLKKPGEK